MQENRGSYDDVDNDNDNDNDNDVTSIP